MDVRVRGVGECGPCHKTMMESQQCCWYWRGSSSLSSPPAPLPEQHFLKVTAQEIQRRMLLHPGFEGLRDCGSFKNVWISKGDLWTTWVFPAQSCHPPGSGYVTQVWPLSAQAWAGKWSLIHDFILLFLRLAACSFYFPFILGWVVISEVLNNPHLAPVTSNFWFLGVFCFFFFLFLLADALWWRCSIISGPELRSRISLWIRCCLVVQMKIFAIPCTSQPKLKHCALALLLYSSRRGFYLNCWDVSPHSQLAEPLKSLPRKWWIQEYCSGFCLAQCIFCRSQGGDKTLNPVGTTTFNQVSLRLVTWLVLSRMINI